jgi:peptidoglycan-associated lipoprotein
MKTLYSAFVFAAAIGLMTGCSTNKGSKTPASESIAPVGEETVQEVVEQPIIIDTTFYFSFDSAELTTAARAALVLHAEQLSASPRAVRLEGHADERGSREYNIALGERRANAVRDFLVLQGVQASAIETVSYGEEQPAVTGSGESSWAKNRRVELK